MAVLSGGLRGIHSRIRLDQQILGGRGALGRESDPDRAADDDRARADLDRLTELAEDPLGRPNRLVLGADLTEEHRELVAALPPDDVLGPDGTDQPLGDLGEDLVAGGMAEGVVDLRNSTQPKEPRDPVRISCRKAGSPA
jgi:hypothetical protein